MNRKKTNKPTIASEKKSKKAFHKDLSRVTLSIWERLQLF